VALETSKLCLVESHNLVIAKLKSDRDITQSVAIELRLQNEKLNDRVKVPDLSMRQ
jgi:hypothetical protein